MLSKSINDVACDIKGLKSAVSVLSPNPQEAQRRSQQLSDILQLLSPLSSISNELFEVSSTLSRWDMKQQGENPHFTWKSTNTKFVEDQERWDIVTWLSPLNFWTKQNDVFSSRQEGTGQWLLDSNKFRDWVFGTGNTLWCSGIRKLILLLT
jgi:hypothetical protein